LDAYLQDKLPDYMVPSLYNFLEEIPLNANGKVDRQALPRVEAERGEETERRAVPQDDIEVVLLGMWRNVLKQEDIAVTDDFFHLGGQSFEAVRLVGLISEEYGRALSLGDIWEDRTVARLAARLRSKESASGCLIRMNDREEGHPLFLVHPAGGNIVCYRELAKRWNRPVYAFQAPGVDGRRSPLGSIPELAETYLSYVNDVQPEGPVLVGGWSSGGLIAYELAVRLRKQGRTVAGVVVIDSPAPFQYEPVGDGDQRPNLGLFEHPDQGVLRPLAEAGELQRKPVLQERGVEPGEQPGGERVRARGHVDHHVVEMPVESLVDRVAYVGGAAHVEVAVQLEHRPVAGDVHCGSSPEARSPEPARFRLRSVGVLRLCDVALTTTMTQTYPIRLREQTTIWSRPTSRGWGWRIPDASNSACSECG
jgi:pimeloyl-ACP methyl ester carboxylesterase